MNIRKIQRLGSSSLIITLPKSWIKKIGLLPGDNVYVVERDNQLVLIPFVTQEPFGPPLVYTVKKGSEEHIIEVAECLIKNGIKNIVIEEEEGLPQETVEKLKGLVKKYGGYRLEVLDKSRVNIKGSIKDADSGQLVREAMSRLADTIELLTLVLAGKEDKSKGQPQQIDIVSHIKAINSLFVNLDSIKGEPLEERKRGIPIYINEETWNTLESVQKELLRLLPVVDASKLDSVFKEKIIKFLKSVESAFWESVGGISNESEKRLIAAKNLAEDATRISEELLGDFSIPLWAGRLVGILSLSLELLKKIIANASCQVEMLSMREES